jgi:GntR family transcriptional regulator
LIDQRPLYVQVRENLGRLITSGEWKPDTRLPSERDLSSQIGVSRATLRQAIQLLLEDGLLYSIHGKGNFVAKPKIEIDTRDLISFTYSMSQRGIQPSASVLDLSRIPASRKVAQALEVEVAHQVYRVHRVRFANALPLAIELSYFPCDRCPGLEDVDLTKVSIRHLFEEKGIRLERVYQTLQAVSATEDEAGILHVKNGFPLMLIERLGYDAAGNAVEFSKDLFRGDCSRFISDLKM